MWEGKSEQANYILSSYLPCAPLFDEETIRNRMVGLPEFCVRYQIPAVMLYVDLNPCWYYLPDTPEHTAYYVEVVRQLAVRLREKGISSAECIPMGNVRGREGKGIRRSRLHGGGEVP